MKADNLILTAVCAVLAWMVWTAFGPGSSSPDPTPKAMVSASAADLSAAIASGQPVLVDFYADWCPPCRAMMPTVHELADDLRGKLKVVQLNVDQNAPLSQQYKVSSIPCFVVLKGGKEAARQVGGMPKAALRQLTGL